MTSREVQASQSLVIRAAACIRIENQLRSLAFNPRLWSAGAGLATQLVLHLTMASRIAAPSSSAGILSLHLGLGRPVMGYSLIRKGKLSASSMTSMLARVPAPVVSSLFTRRHLHSGHIPRPHPVQVLPEAIVNHHSMRLTIRRSFHATSRRRAIPLIPAAIGIFKVSITRIALH